MVRNTQKRLGDTLFRSLLDPAHVHLDVETKPITLSIEQLAELIPELERSANLYLAGIENQLRTASMIKADSHPKRIGIQLFSWEDE